MSKKQMRTYCFSEECEFYWFHLTCIVILQWQITMYKRSTNDLWEGLIEMQNKTLSNKSFGFICQIWFQRHGSHARMRPTDGAQHFSARISFNSIDGQIGYRFGSNALKIYVTRFGFLFLPRHSNERTLDIIVDNFRTAISWTSANFLLMSRKAFRKNWNLNQPGSDAGR